MDVPSRPVLTQADIFCRRRRRRSCCCCCCRCSTRRRREEREEKPEANNLYEKREEKDAANYHASDFAIFLLDQFFGNPPWKQDNTVGFNVLLGNIQYRS